MTANEAEASTSSLDAQQRLQVEAELKRVLASPAFRTSKRSQEFLSYIVAMFLEGKVDELKERVIGIQVFQRMPDYDTGEHSIVRVKANELRKRLAQVYSESDEQWVVQFHLPRGSYTPQFRWREVSIDTAASDAPAEEPAGSGRPWVRAVWIATALVVLCCATWYIVKSQLPPDTAEQFWRPILEDHNPLLLCTGSPEIWRLSAPVEDEPKLPSSIKPSDVTHDVDHYIGWGDAVALSDLASYFARHDKNVTVQLADDVSFTELSQSSVVLVGARSNAWSMQLANNMRFVFVRTGTTSAVRDRRTGNEWSYQPGSPAVDYVILTRILESKTGRMVVLAAGLSHYGTEAAGQALTDSREMQELLKDAPKDWASRDLQLVMRVEVFGRTSGTPRLVASDFP